MIPLMKIKCIRFYTAFLFYFRAGLTMQPGKRNSLCRPGCPQIHGDLHASASQVIGILSNFIIFYS